MSTLATGVTQYEIFSQLTMTSTLINLVFVPFDSMPADFRVQN